MSNLVSIGQNEAEVIVGGEWHTGREILLGDEPVGAVSVDWDMPVPEITGIRVDRRRRGKGIGQAVVRLLLKERPRFYVRSTPAAKGFWESCGARFEGRNEDSGLWEGYVTRKGKTGI